MRKLLVQILVFAFLLMTVSLNAQTEIQEDNNVVIKELPEVTLTSISEVKKKLNKVFTKTFPDAKELEWFTVDKDFLAKFISNDMKHNTLFSKNSRIKYDIAYGFAHNLPTEIRTDINKLYPNYSINQVYSVKETNRNMWFAVLENSKHRLRLKAEGGEIEEVEKLDKTE